MSQRRVLLARIKDEARDVHVCRRATAVQGSLQPLLGLAHSIISARGCGRRMSWQLRSTSSLSTTPTVVPRACVAVCCDSLPRRCAYAQRRCAYCAVRTHSAVASPDVEAKPEDAVESTRQARIHRPQLPRQRQQRAFYY